MPLNLSETRTILNELGHSPRKQLGQNYLVDPNIVRKSIELAELRMGETVVEVGPGLGTLSASILEAGAELYAVEHDKTMAAYLCGHLQTEYPDKFHLLCGDAVVEPLAGFDGPVFKIVANLPYAISTPWLERVLTAKHPPQRMVLMLQKEAADRFVAEPGTKAFGAISIFLRSAFALSGRHVVSPSCFHPPPDVDSVLVRLDQISHPIVFGTQIRRAIRDLFTQRRKQLSALCRKSSEAPILQDWFNEVVAPECGETVRAEAVPLHCWQVLGQRAET